MLNKFWIQTQEHEYRVSKFWQKWAQMQHWERGGEDRRWTLRFLMNQTEAWKRTTENPIGTEQQATWNTKWRINWKPRVNILREIIAKITVRWGNQEIYEKTSRGPKAKNKLTTQKPNKLWHIQWEWVVKVKNKEEVSSQHSHSQMDGKPSVCITSSAFHWRAALAKKIWFVYVCLCS